MSHPSCSVVGVVPCSLIHYSVACSPFIHAISFHWGDRGQDPSNHECPDHIGAVGTYMIKARQLYTTDLVRPVLAGHVLELVRDYRRYLQGICDLIQL